MSSNPVFTCLNGKWKCTYAQVAYDDRYFRVYRKDRFNCYVKVAEFSQALYRDTKDDYLFPFLSKLRDLEDYQSIERFHSWIGTKVKEHDTYLDRDL